AIIAATALLIASEPKGVDPLSRNMFNVYRTLGTYGKERTAVRAGSMRQETIYPLKEIIEGLDDRHPAKVAYLAASLATGNTASSMYTTAANLTGHTVTTCHGSIKERHVSGHAL
ncbi:MAG: hypothetical protein WBJ62_04740, partial [Coriobacteriia bacterium]